MKNPKTIDQTSVKKVLPRGLFMVGVRPDQAVAVESALNSHGYQIVKTHPPSPSWRDTLMAIAQEPGGDPGLLERVSKMPVEIQKAVFEVETPIDDMITLIKHIAKLVPEIEGNPIHIDRLEKK